MREGRAAAIGWTASALLHSSAAAWAIVAADYVSPPTIAGRSNVVSLDLAATIASEPAAAADAVLDMPFEPLARPQPARPQPRPDAAAPDEHERDHARAHQSQLAELPRQASAWPMPIAADGDRTQGDAMPRTAPQTPRAQLAELPPRREPSVDVALPAAKPLPKQSAASIEIAAAVSTDFGLEASLPEPLDNAPPEYPREALARRWQGTVMLRLRISPQGTVAAVEVTRSSGHPVLDAAAVGALGRWRFRPARQGDEPREAVILVPVVFRLPTR